MNDLIRFVEDHFVLYKLNENLIHGLNSFGLFHNKVLYLLHILWNVIYQYLLSLNVNIYYHSDEYYTSSLL